MTGELDAHTTSGEIDVRYAAAPGNVTLGSTSGNVRLSLPAAAAFGLDARSNSGDIRCDFPILISGSSSNGEHALVGAVGSSSASVRVKTVSGDVEVIR